METKDKITKSDIQSLVLEEIIKHQRSSVGLGTGVGKTLIGLLHMQNFFQKDIRFLVVAPKKSIFESWKNDAVKFDMEYLLAHIQFTTYLSLPKRNPNDYDILYLDECHSVKESVEPFLNTFKGKILGLSGTLPKIANSEKGRLMYAFFPPVYNYKTDQAIHDEILNDYRIIVHKLELSTKKDYEVKTKKGQWVTSERANYEYWSGRIAKSYLPKDLQIMRILRMKAIQSYPTKLVYTKKLLQTIQEKCLVFCNTILQAEALLPCSYTSKNKDSNVNLEKFNNGEVLQMSTVLQLGEGINIENLNTLIVLHSYSGGSSKLRQFLGRSLRLKVGEIATIHILVYKDTIDESWLSSALEDFDINKIKYEHS